jgi:hypothetical protein
VIIDEEAYLEHYGVKGMQWGVRRENRRASRERNRKRNMTARTKAKNAGRANAKTHAQRVDEARRRIDSGDALADFGRAVLDYRRNRERQGSRAALDIIARAHREYGDDLRLSRQYRDGTEAAIDVINTFVTISGQRR